MAIKKCCNCNDGKFQTDMFGKSEYICKQVLQLTIRESVGYGREQNEIILRWVNETNKQKLIKNLTP